VAIHNFYRSSYIEPAAGFINLDDVKIVIKLGNVNIGINNDAFLPSFVLVNTVYPSFATCGVAFSILSPFQALISSSSTSYIKARLDRLDWLSLILSCAS
jgi:hypothetical protein